MLTSMTWARLRLVASPALVRADQEPPMLCVSSVGIHPAWGRGVETEKWLIRVKYASDD